MQAILKVAKLLLLVLSLAPAVIQAKEWAFDVFLDKSKMGQHTFALSNNQLTSVAKFNVKVLFIQAYAYDHKAVEKWRDGCLVSLNTNTVENKVIDEVKGSLTESGFVVDNGKTTQTLPECTMTFLTNTSLVVLSFGWAILTPILLKLSERFDGFKA